MIEGTDQSTQGSSLPGPRWRKSSYSANGNNCVEVADLDSAVAVRDSKDPRGPVLQFLPAEWSAFLHAIRNGEFTRL